jgi:predicted Zn finger-like uncharacterized protein
MILTCPACSTRYLVGDDAIGAAGRTVRCAKCGHTWHAEGVAAALSGEAPQAEPKARGEEATAPEQDAAPAKVSAAEEALRPRLRPIPRGSGLPALPGEYRRPVPWGWALLVLVVAGLIAGLMLGRDAIVGAWPAANRLYASLGYPAEVPGVGLEFRNVASARVEEDGRPVLVVRGLISNNTAVERAVPLVRVALKDEGDRIVQQWSFKPDAVTIGPGEGLPFETRLVDPSDRARGLTIEFAPSPER